MVQMRWIDKVFSFFKQSPESSLKNEYWRHKHGEIDLICSDKVYLVFIEVRLRKALALVAGDYSISQRKNHNCVVRLGLFKSLA